MGDGLYLIDVEGLVGKLNDATSRSEEEIELGEPKVSHPGRLARIVGNLFSDKEAYVKGSYPLTQFVVGFCLDKDVPIGSVDFQRGSMEDGPYEFPYEEIRLRIDSRLKLRAGRNGVDEIPACTVVFTVIDVEGELYARRRDLLGRWSETDLSDLVPDSWFGPYTAHKRVQRDSLKEPVASSAELDRE